MRHPVHVLHVTQPVSAGVAAVVLDLVRDQVRRGYRVDVACPVPSPLAARVAEAGARVLPWAARREPGAALVTEWRSLRRIVAGAAPDVVVLHSAKAGLVGRLGRLEPAVVHVPHAWSFEAVSGMTRRAARWWEVLAGAHTDQVVCVSERESVRGRRAGIGAPIAVIGNGIDTTVHHPGDRGQARTELGQPSGSPTVVCVGRLTRQKGQDLLLQAWPSVLASVPDAHLVLVGDGPDRSVLATEVASLGAARAASVTFAGASEDPRPWYAAADVVVLPSRWEGMALVVAEAMASARAVVAFDVDGCAELIGTAGLVVPSEDVTALAGALVDLLLAPERADELGRAGRSRVEVVADLGDTLSRWDVLLRSILDGGDAPASTVRTLRADAVVPQMLGRAFDRVDLAEVTGGGAADRTRALALSSAGVPVRWLADDRPPPSLGAPILPLSTAVENLGEAVGRPGTAVDGAPEPAPGPPVSVVITTLDEGNAVGVVVAELLAQLRPDDELVLVDGGSRDGSIEALRPDPRLRVHVEPGAGISRGRNIGIGAAAHEVIVCTDAGCSPDPGFVEAFRRAFAGEDPPVLASGVYRATARGALERAQALACYPQPEEVRRPSLGVRTYTRLFGTGYDPRFAIGRCVAFTRTAWRAVGGFPEHLATGEDVSFGLAVAETGRVVTCREAAVDWQQRDGLPATWRMYRNYGRSSTDGGDVRLLVRDGARAAAYLVAPLMLGSRRGRWLVAAGAAGYLSLPFARALRSREAPAVYAAIPLALAVKDLGKVAGALQGLGRRWNRRRVEGDS